MTEVIEALFQLFPELEKAHEEHKDLFPVDIYEDEESYKMEAAFPGFSKDSVKVKTEKGSLTITANKKERKDTLVYSETRITGNLERSFKIAEDVDADGISASLKNGLLVVTLPKQESMKLRDIKIK